MFVLVETGVPKGNKLVQIGDHKTI